MSDFITEIEDDYKQEKFDRIIRKVLPIAMFGAVILIFGVLIYNYMDNKYISRQEEISIKYSKAIDALNNKQYDQAEILLDEIIEYKNENYSALAMLEKANLLINQSKLELAIKIYQDLASSNIYNEVTNDLARIALISYNKNKDEYKSDIKLLDQLSKKNRPWQHKALEIKARKLLELGQIIEAREIFTKLVTDKMVPANIANNAKIALIVHGENNEK